MEELLKAHQAIIDAWYAAYRERVRQHIEATAAKRKPLADHDLAYTNPVAYNQFI